MFQAIFDQAINAYINFSPILAFIFTGNCPIQTPIFKHMSEILLLIFR